ncbi:JmjC domain-containing protein 8 [Bulinus truncatus]|nr:JmjC domain-containing protein 8 [Bulinus truncatus]
MARKKVPNQSTESPDANHRSTNLSQTSVASERTYPPSLVTNSSCTLRPKSKMSTPPGSGSAASGEPKKRRNKSSAYPVSLTSVIVGLTVLTVYLAPTIPHVCLEVLWSYLFQVDALHGGWRPVTEEVLKKYGTDICNIQRISVKDLTPSRFEEDFRFKKPVLVTFPNGIKDWTDPYLWSRPGLLSAYSNWTLHSGQSLEIVRAGGNAQHKTTLSEFVERLLGETNETTNEPLFYGFDRRFYYDTELPHSLRLPVYFHTDHSKDDSIFFLGSSLTGVVFHKHSDTWNAVAYGKKRWFLYPTTRTPPGGVYHGFTLMDWFHKVYPQLTEAEKPIECVQRGGEILYLPEGMYHATLNLGDTIALAIQKKDPTIESEILSYEATRLNNLMAEAPDEKSKKSINLRLREIYEKTSELLPENAEAYHKLGITLFSLELYHDALPLFMKAIVLDPYFVLAYIHMAKTLSKGTELMPELVPFWHYYKHCQLQLGDLEGAEQSEKVIAQLQMNQQLKNS